MKTKLSMLLIFCILVSLFCLTGCVSKKDRQAAISSVDKYVEDPLSYLPYFKGRELVGDEEFSLHVIDVLQNFADNRDYAYIGDLIEKLEGYSYCDPDVQTWCDELIAKEPGSVFSMIRYVDSLDYYTIECNIDTVYNYIDAVGKTKVNLEIGYYDNEDNQQRVLLGREYGNYGTYRDYNPIFCGDMCFDHYTGYGIKSNYDLTTKYLNSYVIYYKNLILEDAEEILTDAIIGKLDMEDCISVVGNYFFVETQNEFYIYDLSDTYRARPVIIDK